MILILNVDYVWAFILNSTKILMKFEMERFFIFEFEMKFSFDVQNIPLKFVFILHINIIGQL